MIIIRIVLLSRVKIIVKEDVYICKNKKNIFATSKLRRLSSLEWIFLSRKQNFTCKPIMASI